MKSFRLDQYQHLLDDSTVIEKDARGAKVLLTPQGQIVKLFSLKRWWSSALLRPYAVRFVENARRLRELGLRTVQVDDLCYCRAVRRYLVFYTPVPGETLRRRLECDTGSSELLAAFAGYVAQLHQKGVLFRSIHFGNLIVVDGKDEFGLIDVADMQLKKRSLTIAERIRNFRHMTRYRQDCQALQAFGVERFFDLYLQASDLAAPARATLHARLLGDAGPFGISLPFQG